MLRGQLLGSNAEGPLHTTERVVGRAESLRALVGRQGDGVAIATTLEYLEVFGLKFSI